MNEASTIIGSLGFPIFLILALLVFIDRRAWPAIVKYLDARADESKKRHEDFISAINKFGLTSDTQSKMLIIIDEKLDAHHATTLQRLEVIEAAVTNRKAVPVQEPRIQPSTGFRK